ncbi:MAG: hypothetical protein HC765_08735 [Brachymonas sp.]|nr:hypothetical protein [Brachymonas sp.]
MSFDNDAPLSSGLSPSSISSKIAYPLKYVSSMTRSARDGTASWDAAKTQYRAAALQRNNLTQLPHALSSWGWLHASVGALIWVNRASLGKNLCTSPATMSCLR